MWFTAPGSGETFLGRDYTQGRGYSENVASVIDEEVRKLVDEAYKQCMDILSSHEGQLHIVAKELMEKEKISGDRFKVLMADGYDPEKDETLKAEKEREKAEREKPRDLNRDLSPTGAGGYKPAGNTAGSATAVTGSCR